MHDQALVNLISDSLARILIKYISVSHCFTQCIKVKATFTSDTCKAQRIFGQLPAK